MNKGEQRRILNELYATTSNAEIAKILGISVSLVGRRAFYLGLKKDAQYLSETNRKCALKRKYFKK